MLADGAKLDLLDLNDPPQTPLDLRQRTSAHQITMQYHDPAIQLTRELLIEELER